MFRLRLEKLRLPVRWPGSQKSLVLSRYSQADWDRSIRLQCLLVKVTVGENLPSNFIVQTELQELGVRPRPN